MNFLRRNPADHIEQYLYQLEQLGKSPHTLRSYRGTLSAWVASGLSAEDWILTLAATRKKSSVNVARAVLSGYYNWLVRNGRSKENPVSRTRPAKVPQRILRTLTVSEVARLIDACQMVGTDKQTLVPRALSDDAYRARLAAMISVQVTSGMRVAELCRLEIEDVNIRDRWVRVIGKGDKERMVRFGRVAAEKLDRWIDYHGGGIGTVRLFGQISPRSYYRQLQEAARWAELEGVHPHTLRHTFATLAVDSGIPAADLQAMLGHSQITTTLKYVHRAPERGWDRFSQHPLESV